MNLLSKVATAGWFLARPGFWRQGAELVRREFRPDLDSNVHQALAAEWAAQRAVPVQSALETIGLLGEGTGFPKLPEKVLAQAAELVRHAPAQMGGAGDLDLIYAAAELSGARRAVETGVALGWSSLAILAAMARHDGGRLISVDMPYPKLNNEAFVGVAVPKSLRQGWTLIRLPDRNGLKQAIAEFDGSIDFVHYDSDKSYYGRGFAYPLIWQALVPGGVFISDDIQDNMRFAEFVADRGVPFAVTESAGKFVGICRKP